MSVPKTRTNTTPGGMPRSRVRTSQISERLVPKVVALSPTARKAALASSRRSATPPLRVRAAEMKGGRKHAY